MDLTYTLPEYVRGQPATRGTEIFSSGARTPAILVGFGGLSSRSASVEQSRPSVVITAAREEPLGALEWKDYEWEPIATGLSALEALRGFDVCTRWIDARDQLVARTFFNAATVLSEIATAFTLNTTQLAEVTRTSRQTIYDWRRGQPLRTSARTRLDQLAAFGQQWSGLATSPVGDALENRDPKTGKSLLDLLTAELLDGPAITAHMERLNEHLHAFWAEADADTAKIRQTRKTQVPATWREHTLSSITGRPRRK